MKSGSRTIKRLAVTGGLLLWGFATQAQESSFYIEADIGRSGVSDSEISLDESAGAFRVAAGYQPIKWLAIDVGYIDFGSVDASVPDPLGQPVSVEAEANGMELALVGRIPLGDRFAVTARAEKIWWDSKVRALGFTETDSGNDFGFGAGAELTLNDSFTITGTWQSFDFSGTDVDLLSIGLRFYF